MDEHGMGDHGEEWLTWTDADGTENRGLIRMRTRICTSPHDAEVVCSECRYFLALTETPASTEFYLIELTFPEGDPEREDSPGVLHIVDPTHPHYGALVGLFGGYLAQDGVGDEADDGAEEGDGEGGEEGDEDELTVGSPGSGPPARLHPQLAANLSKLPAQLTVYLQTMLHAAPAGWVVGPLGTSFPTGEPTVVYLRSSKVCVEVDLGMLECFGADPESHLAMWRSITATTAAQQELGVTLRYNLVMTDIPHSYGNSFGFTRMFSVEPWDIGEA